MSLDNEPDNVRAPLNQFLDGLHNKIQMKMKLEKKGGHSKAILELDEELNAAFLMVKDNVSNPPSNQIAD